MSLPAILRRLNLEAVFLQQVAKFGSLVGVVFYDEDPMCNRTGRLASREIVEHQRVPLSTAIWFSIATCFEV
jgi:hypothetical protein